MSAAHFEERPRKVATRELRTCSDAPRIICCSDQNCVAASNIRFAIMIFIPAVGWVQHTDRPFPQTVDGKDANGFGTPQLAKSFNLQSYEV